ncbi:ADP-forming succinate--CoA ligase subunit beta [Candidatus Zixiibacteriota bacterium]
MKVHEFQAKEVLSRYGVTVPENRVASTPEEAEAAAVELGGGTVVVKAQIHAGGRGKGGGVKVVSNPAEAKAAAEEMLGKPLITHQTGPEGQLVRIVIVEAGMSIASELYAGIVLDRVAEKPVFMASSEGGMEIEVVAANTPEKIIKEWFDTSSGLLPYQARDLAYAIGLKGKQASNAAKFFIQLAKAYIETDASLAEINPLVVTTDGEVMALDAKINFDDNALYRHGDIAGYHDPHEEDPLEVEAQAFDLNYIKLDGNIGCMVNGAGLAMATMDLIKYAGGEPANFLDVGGAADVETVSNGFRILMSDKNVKAVLINIFGGIVRCDRVALGVVEAMSNVKVDVPVVVRLEGTNAEEASQILNDSDLDFLVAKDFKDAAEKAVAALGITPAGEGA